MRPLQGNPGPVQVTDKPGAIELEDTGSGYDIDLDNVTFGYRPDQPILQVHADALC